MKYKLVDSSEQIYRVETRGADPDEAPRVRNIISNVGFEQLSKAIIADLSENDPDSFLVSVSLLLDEGPYRTTPDLALDDGTVPITASVDVHTALGDISIEAFPIFDAAIFTLGHAMHHTYLTDHEHKTLWAAIEVLARGKGISHITATQAGVRSDDAATPSPTPPAANL